MPNNNSIGGIREDNKTFLASFDNNLKTLWKNDSIIHRYYTVVADKNNNIYAGYNNKVHKINAINGNIIWTNLKAKGTGLSISDNDILYSQHSNSFDANQTKKDINIIHALDAKNGMTLWALNNKYMTVLDQTGLLYTRDGFKIQTSSKGLSRGGWPMGAHDTRHTANASKPIYLKEYPNNNNHKKVICEVDNKTIDINKLTHLSKGWHLLGNSYETKDYCPFGNINYVYYYNTSNKKFNKININDELTYKTIPKHSGLFIYNKYEDNLTKY